MSKISWLAAGGKFCRTSLSSLSLISLIGLLVGAALHPSVLTAATAQTITFSAPTSAFTGTTLSLNASASSGLAVTYAASPAAVCTVSGNVVTFLTSGTCSVTASQSGNGSYSAAKSVALTLSVSVATTNVLTSGCLFVMNPLAAGSFYPVQPGVGSGFGAGCDMYVNSSGNSLNVAAGNGISARSFNIVGPASGASVANATVTPAPKFLSAAIADPLAFLTAPTAGSCTATGANISTTTTLSPGTYCNGLTITGATVTLNPGLYIVAGPLNILNGANIKGTGVTFYLTAPAGSTTYGPLKIANSTVNVAAPAATATAGVPGIVFFGDRKWIQTGTQGVTIAASSVTADGFWYFPHTGIAANSSTLRCPDFGGLVVDNLTGVAATWSFPAANNSTIFGQTGATAQTITFNAPSTATAGTTLTLSATASSGLAVTYAASPASVCTVSGSVASFLTAGSCAITASQAGNNIYSAAKSVTQTISVSTAAQTITFTAPTTTTAGTKLTLNATASSGLTVTYAASPASVCTVSGGVASFLTAGSCSITASQSGNASYAAAKSVTQTVTVSSASQTITFTAPATATAGTTLTLSATASSGLAVTYAASPASVCTVSGGVASFLTAGSCSITASQSGNASYAAAKSVTQTVTVASTSQTITFTAPTTATAGTALTLNATASSGLTVTYSASPASVCTVSGSVASLLTAGSCSITASQSGNASYSAATSVTQTVTVSSASQTITFTAPTTATAGTTLTLNATASSGLTVTYAASPSSVCTVSGSVASLLTAGSCSITASQSGNASYSAATSVTQTVTVSSASQTITFTAPTTATAGTTLTLSATASSGLTVTYAASPASVCTVSGNAVSLLTAGSCSITASQSGNASYAAAKSVTQTVTVSSASQTITFTAPTTATAGTTLTLNATASSGLIVTYAASPSSVCTVSGSVASLLTAGSCSITASQAGNNSYSAATSVTQTVTVSSSSSALLTTGCLFVMNPDATGSFYPVQTSAGSGFGAGCDMYINSTANSLSVPANNGIVARSFNIVGPASGASIAGASVNPAPKFGSVAVADPLAFLVPPPLGPCSSSPNYINAAATLSPGIYCGGLTINGAQVTLNPGLYVIQGPLVIENGANVSGTGVTFYLTASTSSGTYGPLSILSASVNLSAPTASATLGIPGVLFWGDRNWVQSAAQGVSIKSSGVTANGFWYFPGTGILLAGSSLIAPSFGGLVVDNLLGEIAESWSFPSANNSTIVGNANWLATSSLAVFGSPVGVPSPTQTLTLSNSGSAPITISNISLSGLNAPDFTLNNSCGTVVAARSSCSLSLGFTPSVSGGETATLSINSNASNGNLTLPLSGVGQMSSLTLNPTSLSFGGPVGIATATQVVTVSASGGLPVNISAVSLGGTNPSAFIQSNTCIGTLAPGASCNISVSFMPAQTGQQTATLSISSNATNGAQTVALTGNGPVQWTALGPVNILNGVGATGVAGTCSDALYMAGNPSTLMLSGSHNNSAAGIRVTQDGGATWTWQTTGLADFHINTLATDTSAPNSYYAASNNGMFHTADNASTWQTANYSTATLGSPEFSMFWIAINGTQTLVTGTTRGIAQLPSGSSTWSLQTPPSGPVMIYTLSGVVAANGDTIIYASVDLRDPNYATAPLYEIAIHNGAWTWTALTLHYIQSSVDPSNPQHIIGSEQNTYQVRQSFDGGVTDSLITDGSGNTYGAWFVSFDPRDATGKTMFIAGDGFLDFTIDGGNTWSNPLHTFTTGMSYVFSMGADYQRIIYMGSSDTLVCSDQGLFHLDKTQNALTQLSALINNSIVVAAAVSHVPGDSATNILVNLWDWSPTASWDGGQTWPTTVGQYWWLDNMGTGSPSAGEGGQFFTMNAGQDGNSHAVEMTNYGYTMFYSSDGGHSFLQSAMDAIPTGHSRNFNFDTFSSAQSQTALGFSDTGTVYVGANEFDSSGNVVNGLVVASQNYGATWAPLPGVPFNSGEILSTLGVDPYNAKHLMVSTGSRLLQSTDAGVTWTAGALPGNTHSALVLLSWSRSTQGVVAALNSGNEFLLSKDDGATWQVLSVPYPSGSIPVWITYSPTSNSLVAAAKNDFPASRSVLLSHDNGTTWTDITGNIQSTMLNRATWDGNDLYIASSGQGLLKLAALNAH